MVEYYDGARLLSKKDINGNKPEIYLCTSNRSAGKTTYFNRWCVNRFLKHSEKFAILYRFKYELDGVHDKFFKDIKNIFFKDMEMESKNIGDGSFKELFLNKKPCGYALSLNTADNIKKYSHLLSDVQRMLFDEFQSETNHYVPNEIKKFISIHTSVARGCGEQSRYVPVIMISNPISIINPYYTELGISERLKEDTIFLRGDGFVLEQSKIESASKALKNSGFNNAFKNNEYTAYASEAIYLNDNKSFIDKPKGKSSYLLTLKYNGSDFAIREFSELGILYCDTNVDSTHKFKITASTDDLNINYVMLRKNDYVISQLRYFFEKGCFRFKDLRCKEAIMKTLSY